MTIVKTENGVSMYADSRKGTDAAQLHEMLCVWRQAAAMLKAGEITQDEYDRWRYTYPEVEVQRTRDALDEMREQRRNEQ